MLWNLRPSIINNSFSLSCSQVHSFTLVALWCSWGAPGSYRSTTLLLQTFNRARCLCMLLSALYHPHQQKLTLMFSLLSLLKDILNQKPLNISIFKTVVYNRNLKLPCKSSVSQSQLLVKPNNKIMQAVRTGNNKFLMEEVLVKISVGVSEQVEFLMGKRLFSNTSYLIRGKWRPSPCWKTLNWVFSLRSWAEFVIFEFVSTVGDFQLGNRI